MGVKRECRTRRRETAWLGARNTSPVVRRAACSVFDANPQALLLHPAIRLDLQSMDSRSGGGHDGRRRIGSTPAGGDVVTADASRTPRGRRQPRSGRGPRPRSRRAPSDARSGGPALRPSFSLERIPPRASPISPPHIAHSLPTHPRASSGLDLGSLGEPQQTRELRRRRFGKARQAWFSEQGEGLIREHRDEL